MSQSEEPPSMINQALNANLSTETAEPSSKQHTPFPMPELPAYSDDITPRLPPQMASVRSHTADEIITMMNRTPLFMTSLDDVEEKDGRNTELEAIRALQYEGSPAEIAQGFKEQGNEMVKLKRWKDGQEFYTKGIIVLSQQKRERINFSKGADGAILEIEEEIELQEETRLNEVCHVNRALCNLELKNYRSTTLDCATVLKINPMNVKAYYRSSSALFALGKLSDAWDACRRGLTLEPSNVALKALGSKIESREKALIAAQQNTQREFERTQMERTMLSTALRARNIRIRNTTKQPDLEDATIHLTPDPLSPTSILNFPVILLYPLHAQSDFIKAFSELDTVPQHLDYVLPLPWDEQQEYTNETVELFVETGTGGMVKMGKKVTLGKVLGSDGVEVLDGVVRINVVLRGKTTAWIAEMKSRKG